MKKLKFPEDFFAYNNPDCPDKDIEKAVNKMKNWMKGETYKSNPWFFMAAGNYLIVGLIATDGQKTIYVARQYYEIVNIPGALEKFIDNVQAGKGRYGLCDACLNRQGDYCLFHNLHRWDESGKHTVTAQKLDRIEHCNSFNYAGWII